jgi:hypothetical protein
MDRIEDVLDLRTFARDNDYLRRRRSPRVRIGRTSRIERTRNTGLGTVDIGGWRRGSAERERSR